MVELENRSELHKKSWKYHVENKWWTGGLLHIFREQVGEDTNTGEC